MKTRAAGCRRPGGCSRASAPPGSTPAIFSATYASIVVERSGGPLEPVRPRAVVAAPREQLVRELAVGVGGRAGRGSGARRGAAAIIVAFDSSSPTHQPSGCWSSSRRLGARVDRAVERCQLLHDGHARHRLHRIDRTRRRKTAANRALHRRRPAGVGPGARADDVRAGPSRGPRRARCVPGRSAKVAHGSRLTRDHSSSACPSRLGQLLRPSGRRGLGPRISSSSGTPLETTVRYWPSVGGRVPGQRAAVEDPVGRATEQRGERRAQDRAVEEQVDADDRRVLEPGLGSPRSARATPPAAARRRRRRRRCAARRRPAAPVEAGRARRSAPSRPRPRVRAPAASPCIAPSGAGRKDQVARPRGPSSAVCTVKTPSAALASSARRFSAGRMKTSQKRSIACPERRAGGGASPNVSPSCSRVERAAVRQRRAATESRSRERQMTVAEEREPARCRWWRRRPRPRRSPAARAARRAVGAAAADAARGKRGTRVKQPSAMCCPLSGGGDGSPSRSGSVWTAPPSVGRASRSVDLVAGVDELERGGEPCETAADDHALSARNHTFVTTRSHTRVVFRATVHTGGAGPKAPGDSNPRVIESHGVVSHVTGDHRSSPRPTIRSFVSGESRGRSSKTSNPRCSIRSSVAS